MPPPAPDLLLTYDFPPLGGGIARWMLELARRWPRPLVVSTGSLAGSAAADAVAGCRVERVAVPSDRLRTLPGLVRWTRAAARLAARESVGFTWCGTVRPGGYPAWWLRHRHGIPGGLIVYGGDLISLERRAETSTLKRAAARRLVDADVIVAISRWTGARCAALLDRLGLAGWERRVQVVPLGSDPLRFRPDLDPGPVRERLALPPGPLLLTVARLVPHKGIDTGIRALAGLAGRYPGLHYVVAGAGADRERLEDLAVALGVAPRIRLLGAVAEEDLPGLYAAADLYLGMSREEGGDVEGFGISIADAAAAGRPVVAGRSGGTADAMVDGETGVLVPPEDPAEAAAAIAALLDDPARRAGMGAAGRRLVETHLNWDRVVRDLAAIRGELAS